MARVYEDKVSKLARRFVTRHKLIPPVDVAELVSSRANLHYLRFPNSFGIDGLCTKLKVPGERPDVFVNSAKPRARMRFTLAHELGHIVIPWHIGSIFDDIEADQNYDLAAWCIEQEANRFASEILMPFNFMEGCAKDLNIEDFFREVTDTCQVSTYAAFLRIRLFLPRSSLLFMETPYSESLVVERSPGSSVWLGPFESVAEARRADVPNGEVTCFELDGHEICAWTFPNRLSLPEVDLATPWRSELDKCVAQIGGFCEKAEKKVKASINAKVSNVNSSLRGCSVLEELYAEAVHRFSADAKLRDFLSKVEFHRFLVLRLSEMLDRRRT